MSSILAVAILACTSPVTPSKEFPAEVCWKVVTATFRVITQVPGKGKDRDGVVSQTGTAFAIGSNNGVFHVLTAAHVVRGVDTLTLDTFGKAGFPAATLKGLRAQVVDSDAKVDLALIKLVVPGDVPKDSLPGVLELARMNEMDPRKEKIPVLSVGCAQGFWPTCRFEKTIGKKLIVGDYDASSFYWEIRDKGSPGRSGGPLVNREGKVIGVCSAVQRGNGYYVHTDEIEYFLKKNGFDWHTGRNSINIPQR